MVGISLGATAKAAIAAYHSDNTYDTGASCGVDVPQLLATIAAFESWIDANITAQQLAAIPPRALVKTAHLAAMRAILTVYNTNLTAIKATLPAATATAKAATAEWTDGQLFALFFAVLLKKAGLE